MPSNGQVKHNAWEGCEQGLEWVYTQAEESPAAPVGGREWEGKEKEECPQTIDTGRGAISLKVMF